MKNVFFIILYAAFFGWAMPLFAAETYVLDPLHSYVLWHVSHFGFSSPSGKWQATGDILLDEKNPQNSKVSATIDVADGVTGIKELDKHLKAPLFFDTAQFPNATFVSDQVILTGKKTAKIKGTLTVHGVAKPITLSATLNKIAPSPLTQKSTVGFSAHAELKRSDFGITTLLPGLSDQVDLDIEVEAVLKDK